MNERAGQDKPPLTLVLLTVPLVLLTLGSLALLALRAGDTLAFLTALRRYDIRLGWAEKTHHLRRVSVSSRFTDGDQLPGWVVSDQLDDRDFVITYAGTMAGGSAGR